MLAVEGAEEQAAKPDKAMSTSENAAMERLMFMENSFEFECLRWDSHSEYEVKKSNARGQPMDDGHAWSVDWNR